MIMKKKFYIPLLILSLLSLNSCSHIKDVNGLENYQLETITLQDVLNGTNHIEFMSKSWNSEINGVRSSVLSISKFSGVKEIHSTYLTNESITYYISNEVYEGNFAIYIINNNKVIKTIEANQEETFTLNEIRVNCILKIAGESANFKMKYKIS